MLQPCNLVGLSARCTFENRCNAIACFSLSFSEVNPMYWSKVALRIRSCYVDRMRYSHLLIFSYCARSHTFSVTAIRSVFIINSTKTFSYTMASKISIAILLRMVALVERSVKVCSRTCIGPLSGCICTEKSDRC